MKIILMIYLITCWVTFALRTAFIYYAEIDREKYNIFPQILLSAGLTPLQTLKIWESLTKISFVFFPVINVLNSVIYFLMIICYKKLFKKLKNEGGN